MSIVSNVAIDKMCPTCHEYFIPMSNYQRECKPCKAEYDHEHHAENLRHRQSQMMFRRVGITLDEYDVILATQNGVCAICGSNPIVVDSRNLSPRRLHVDHD